MNTELVAGLIIRDGKLLLIHNTKHGGVRIEPPGGKVEGNETLWSAVAREVKEELGIDVRVGVELDAFRTNSPEGEFLVYMYFCTIIAGEPEIKEPDKSSGFGWYYFRDLERFAKEGKLVPNLVEALPELGRYLY